MTNEEAIQIAEERIYTARYNAETLNNKGLRKINENQEEWLSRIICLTKKQMPQKVTGNYSYVKAFDATKNTTEKFRCYPCPSCGKWICANKNHKYCEWCGQALDWSETNDK